MKPGKPASLSLCQGCRFVQLGEEYFVVASECASERRVWEWGSLSAVRAFQAEMRDEVICAEDAGKLVRKSEWDLFSLYVGELEGWVRNLEMSGRWN